MFEVISQNMNPLNHLPSPLKIKSKIRIKTKVNPWHTFRKEVGIGKFTKKTYGTIENAKSVRSDAYKKWKSKNGYK